MLGYAAGFLLGTSAALAALLPSELAGLTAVAPPLSCLAGVYPIRCVIVIGLRTCWCACSTLLCKWLSERWMKPVGLVVCAVRGGQRATCELWACLCARLCEPLSVRSICLQRLQFAYAFFVCAHSVALVL